MRGIDPEHGLTSDHLQELKTDQAILGSSDTVIIVADGTKFGRVATSRTAPVKAASRIVTVREAPAEILEAIRAQGVDVWQV
jgi:DeoR family transcriptional regulator of aga operon/DeoR family fructose operon transcriptional repressor